MALVLSLSPNLWWHNFCCTRGFSLFRTTNPTPFKHFTRQSTSMYDCCGAAGARGSKRRKHVDGPARVRFQLKEPWIETAHTP
eukprot:898460-Amphidinium_carterae.1